MNIRVASVRAIFATVLLAVGACSAGESDANLIEATFKLSGDATAEQVGLPNYPGAKLFKEEEDSNAGANILLNTPVFGFKVVAVKLQSSDSPERIAAYYRRALAKYGDVLDCSSGAKRSAEGELSCDSDEPERHSLVYKAGTDKNQHIVAIRPRGKGSQFDLVHLDIRGESN